MRRACPFKTTLFVALLICGCLRASQSLPRSAPEAQGVSSASVLQFVDAAESRKLNLHSFMLVRHGVVVAEGWWAPYGPDLRHTLYSLSKSFTSTAIGIAVDEGRLGLDDKVVGHFPQDLPETVSPNLAAMRVKDLLMMGAGHKSCALFGSGIRNIPDCDWTKLALSRPVEYEPGTKFVYNTGATYLLSAILQKTTGQNVMDYLTPRLFKPLGIDDADWECNPQGISTGGWGLRVRTEDIAKLGQLYLQKGLWRGKRIVSEAWVREATRAQISNAGPNAAKNAVSDWAQGYGFQFWRCRNDAFRGDGAFGQYCVVMPQQDAVVAMTSETQNLQATLDAVWEFLLPAMQPAALSADPKTSAQLKTRLEALTLPLPPGQASSPAIVRANRQNYAVVPNTLGIRQVSLDFDGDSCIFRMKDADAEHSVACGIGRWKDGETSVSPAPLHLVTTKHFTKSRVAGAGAWQDENTFVMHWRFTETAHYQTVTCRFEGDAIHVSFKKSAAILNPSTKDDRPALIGQRLGPR